jgi:uncharacterized membrane protein (DUF373 family)
MELFGLGLNELKRRVVQVKVIVGVPNLSIIRPIFVIYEEAQHHNVASFTHVS